MTFAEEVIADRTAKNERDERVRYGEEAPACFTCGAPSTHVSDGITPAGYLAYQCARHARVNPTPLFGSDPGWSVAYITLEAYRRCGPGVRCGGGR